MEEKFALNELDQRWELWGWKWEAGFSSSSLCSQASLLLFPHFSCWASHLSLLLSEPLSLPLLHLCVHLSYTYSHTLSEPLTIAALSFCPFIFFPQPHVVNKCKKLWSDVEKSLVTIKKNKKMLHLPMSERTLFRIFKVSTTKNYKWSRDHWFHQLC